jgi:hypothetical protein
VTKVPQKILTRPKDSPPDPLEHSAKMFDFGYVPAVQDLRAPQLSVGFAERDKLPPKLCIVGCELDLLCREAELFAEKMASIGSGERAGSEILWEQNGVRWEKILGEFHGISILLNIFYELLTLSKGFDVMVAFGETKIRTTKRKKVMYDSVAEWLFRDVYM